VSGFSALVAPELAVINPYVDAGVLGPAEVQLAATLTRLSDRALSEGVIIGIVFAARGPRLGHVRVSLTDIAAGAVGIGEDVTDEFPWPPVEDLLSTLQASDLVATPSTYRDEPFRPLVLDDGNLYLQRYFDHELRVAGDLIRRAATSASLAGDPVLEAHLDDVFGPDPTNADLQRRAAHVALTQRVSVIAGGPGTGKTRTIAGILAVAHLARTGSPPLRVALAAPTGKAATRMVEAMKEEREQLAKKGLQLPDSAVGVSGSDAQTLHRLLGWVPGRRPRHDRSSPVPFDMVIVDEMSMVSLPHMSRLLEALHEDARIVLVGDTNQLASIEAGTVLSDVVGPVSDVPMAANGSVLQGKVVTLTKQYRFKADSPIALLANAVRRQDTEEALAALRVGTEELTWILPQDGDQMDALRDRIAGIGVRMVEAARRGDGRVGIALGLSLKLLCATRKGPLGLYQWSQEIEAEVAARTDLGRRGAWYVGRPIIVTANDYVNQVYNGDIGLVVQKDGSVVVEIPQGTKTLKLPPTRLDRVETWWAMTIHKSQGSEFDHAVVSLPDAGSRILTKELLYTGITRAKKTLTIVATEEALRAAISRRIERASGLCDRLWPGDEQNSN